MEKIKSKRYLKLSLIIISFLIALFLLSFGSYSVIYAKKTYKNVYVGNINLSGKNEAEAKAILSEKTKSFLNTPIVLQYQSDKPKEFTIKPEDLGIQYDIDGSISKAWNYGRDGKVLSNSWQQLKSLFKKNDFEPVFSFNQSGLDKKISEIAEKLDYPEKDYTITYSEQKFVLSKDRQEGQRINQNSLQQSIKNSIPKFDTNKIVFKIESFKPQITEENAQKALSDANEILDGGELTLTFQDQEFSADKDIIGGFVDSEADGVDLKLSLNQTRINSFIGSIAKNIDRDPKNAKLAVQDNKAVITESAIIGQKLDQTQTLVDIGNSLFTRIKDMSVKANPSKINLKVEVNNPEITNDSVAKLGINELIGTGTTDFKKSPANRTHNIQIGATALNGVLLKPAETFSTLKHLAPIDASNGYLEELVIKENKTTPEFGGGLCQVSSTLFRAALNAGLKITERQNHKYRVSYYEPPVGMDATIYDPSPDFKFINNFNSYIFIQSHIDGTKLTFDVYGTKDGRQVTISEPQVYDVVDPGPPVYVETSSINVGEKKLTEKAHQGASAKFDYNVVRGTETLQSKTFVSKYVPWPEKWLVGTKTPDPAPPAPLTPDAQVPPAPTS